MQELRMKQNKKKEKNKNWNTKQCESRIAKKLKNINLIKPTLHRYLTGHMKSQIRRIDADEFTIATLLPVQRFKKESDTRVWADSKGMI